MIESKYAKGKCFQVARQNFWEDVKDAKMEIADCSRSYLGVGTDKAVWCAANTASGARDPAHSTRAIFGPHRPPPPLASARQAIRRGGK